MSLQIKEDDKVFVATDPDIPGLLVVSKDRDKLISVLVPKAISDLEIARLRSALSWMIEATTSSADHAPLLDGYDDIVGLHVVRTDGTNHTITIGDLRSIRSAREEAIKVINNDNT